MGDANERPPAACSVSCDATQLLNIPRDLGEFVIVHELVHLLVPSHSKLFKSYLHAYLPDWETRQAWLSKAGAKMRTRHT